MTGLGIIGLLVLVFFLGILSLLTVVERRWPASFRQIRAFEALKRAIERSVETGERVHVSLGTGSLTGPDSAPALAGLAVLGRVAEAAAMSDRPPVVTTGNGAIMVLAQDTLRTTYQASDLRSQNDPLLARMVGPTAMSYIAGLPPVATDEGVSVHVLTGAYGMEGALAGEYAERQGAFVMGGTDDVASQALLFIATQHPIVGEEVFAGGAYLNAGVMHRASLRAQDVVRGLIVALIIIGVILRTLGVSL